MKAILLMLLALSPPVSNRQQSDQQRNKQSDKESGHDFLFEAYPDQCTDVTYTEVATGIKKDAGGATPRSVRLAPKLYDFTCKCGSINIEAKNTEVGQAASYRFHCEIPVAIGSQSRDCVVDTNHAINDHERIGDQDVFHITCSSPGEVTSAHFASCAFAGGEPCSHINARNERSGACLNNPKAACIYYQTNDGNFKVIHGVFTYTVDTPRQ